MGGLGRDEKRSLEAEQIKNAKAEEKEGHALIERLRAPHQLRSHLLKRVRMMLDCSTSAFSTVSHAEKGHACEMCYSAIVFLLSFLGNNERSDSDHASKNNSACFDKNTRATWHGPFPAPNSH